MGLFVTEDGQFQGWLAAFLCCCAAVADDESPHDQARSHSSTRVGVCNQQPSPLTILPSIPTHQSSAYTKGDEPFDLVHNPLARPSYLSDRPPSLKPLDLGDGSLYKRWPYHSKQKTPLGHSSRPSIGSPSNFRRLDHTDTQIQSLVPLRLGPVVLRESPVPDTDIPERPQNRARSDSTQYLLPEDTRAESYRVNRDTPFQRCQQRSSGMWPLPPAQAVPMEIEHPAPPVDERRSVRPATTPRSRSSSSLRRQGTETSTSSMSSRPSSERLRPKRKRSFQSMRRTFGDDDDDIEKEIVELNTIVEERRAETAREGTPDEHVAAVAPSMPIRARSETLDAIGSALSRPVTARDLHRPSNSLEISPEWSIRRSTSSTNRVSTRVSGWLSGIFPSASTTQLPNGEPFYKCQPPPRPVQRSYSESSIITSLADMDSPSLTAASSPTSKFGHSRSHTGESWMTPRTPAAMYPGYGEYEDQKSYDRWPTTSTGQVGLAL